ncbi:MAG: DNA integrity scanning protein DisA [Tetrasphaera sp.]|nr:DNA integrity scanning protein DisA [Tetrasphaera sp.]
MAHVDDDLLRATLAAVAPGTELRDGLERILRGNTGALIVLGHNRHVEALCTGGFPLDVEFSATRLRELAKMDGAIVVNNDITRIVRAATQLVPDPNIETSESGTRHRTAERVAKQTGLPVVSVSQSMRIVALYVAGRRHVLEGSSAILSHANQALQTLERYRARLDEVTGTLSALEIEDLVTARDVAAVLQRMEMVRRIGEEVRSYVVELGVDGRLLTLQLDELTIGLMDDLDWVVRDYLPADHGNEDAVARVRHALTELNQNDLVDPAASARVIGLGDGLDSGVSPRGYRILSRVPRLPGSVFERLVDHFGSLQRLINASSEDLQSVDGVGEGRARNIRESLTRLAESSILERYV